MKEAKNSGLAMSPAQVVVKDEIQVIPGRRVLNIFDFELDGFSTTDEYVGNPKYPNSDPTIRGASGCIIGRYDDDGADGRFRGTGCAISNICYGPDMEADEAIGDMVMDAIRNLFASLNPGDQVRIWNGGEQISLERK